MTRAERAPWMDDVDPVVVDAVRERWRRGMPDADLQRLAVALTVPCVRCEAQPGIECRSVVDDGETRFGFHILDRGRDAGVRWEPTTPAEVTTRAVKRRDANGWPEVPPPGTDTEDDQGYRR